MTNNTILRVYKGINDLIEQKVVLNIKASYLLSKNKMVLKPYVDTIEKERVRLYRQYGKELEDGRIKVDSENLPELQKDLEELLKIDNVVNVSMIKLDDFGDVNVEFGVLDDLMEIIEE